MVFHNLKLLYFQNNLRLVCTPLLSWQTFIIDPKYSSGVMIVALIHGSSIFLISVGSGRLEGFCRSIISPLFI